MFNWASVGFYLYHTIELRSYVSFPKRIKKRETNVKENDFLMFGSIVENMKENIL